MDTGLRGKVALITGPTGNHGRASALAFAAEGADLFICTRQSMDRLEETAHMAERIGARVVTARCDLTVEDEVDALVAKGMREFERIDVVVNSAGWRIRGDLLNMSAAAWNAALAVNVHAPFLLCKAVLPHMVERRWGRIINYTGTAPYLGSIGQGVMKMATLGLTRAIARTYGKYGITANCIGPGRIAVERVPGQELRERPDSAGWSSPVPRPGTVEECAAMVVFLASEGAAYVTGQNCLVNGGAYFL